MNDLSILTGETVNSAHDINDNGQIAGVGETPNGPHGILWDNINGLIDLGDLPGGLNFSIAYGVNNNGQVVGKSEIETGGTPFLWDSSNGMTAMGALGSVDDFGIANDINENGQVVGHNLAATATQGFHAFLYGSDYGKIDLNSLLVDPTGWELFVASAINNSGQIAGHGFHNGLLSAFLLNPVAEGSIPEVPLLPEPPATPPEEGEPVVFDFPAFEVEPEQTVFIDPIIAVGYDYFVNSGPNIASVLLPTIPLDDGLYQIYLWDDTTLAFDIFLNDAYAGIEFFFDSAGVDRFRVLGIDAAALLDPANPVAFVTGLTFVSSGTVDMSMSPVTLFVEDTGGGAGVPEPMAVTMFGAGLFGLGWMRRRPRVI